ncbi:MAG TPA: SulP family inorganic anion transporter [Opitutaceae bacterium]|nr:SulP family inorganic anion transporter [Opitutaceae bacterium]
MNPAPTNTAPDLRHRVIGDAWGGVAAMLVALPSAIAYGVAAYGTLGPDYVGYGVHAGLAGAFILGLVTALIGGSSTLITTPSAPAAAVIASLSVAFLGGDGHAAMTPAQVTAVLTLIALLAGVMQALFGALGGGRLIKYIPYPVVAGYLSAVGVMIFLSQVPKLVGADRSLTGISQIIQPESWRWPALVVSGVTILVMVMARKVVRAVPAAILALLSGTACYLLIGFFIPTLLRTVGNPLLLGNVTATASGTIGAPDAIMALGRLSGTEIAAAIAPALTLSVLLSIDTLKTCVVVDALTLRRHNSNRTLLGQGMANIASAIGGGMPGSGAIGATMVNLESGGASSFSGIFEGVSVLVVVLLFGRWIAWVPLAALAGILSVVAWRMFDWNSLHLVRQKSTVLDFLVIATVVVVAVLSNLVAAAGAGVALAMILFIRDHTRGSVIRRKLRGTEISSKQHRLEAEQAILELHGRDITVCELQGSLFFGTTDQLFREIEGDLWSSRYLILDLRRVQSLDFTATHLFEQFETILAEHDGWLLFSRVPLRRELRNYFSAHGAADRHANTRTFETLDDALEWAEDRLLELNLAGRHAEITPLALGDFELMRECGEDDALSPLATTRTVGPGESIFMAGDTSDELFLVRRGVVKVMLPLNGRGYHTLASFGRGHFFGEMAFLIGGIRSANAVATTAVDLFVISRTRFDEVSRTRPEVGLRILLRLAQALAVRLRRTDAELRALYDA